jgi:8-oxo-dGTP diphosphatase
VAVNAKREVLVVDAPEGAFLPGGGVEAGEDLGEALAREFREETGLVVQVTGLLGEADQYVGGSDVRPGWRKASRFYAVDAPHEPGVPEEPGHEVLWLPVEQACATLRDESHRWAVRLALLGLASHER